MKNILVKELIKLDTDSKDSPYKSESNSSGPANKQEQMIYLPTLLLMENNLLKMIKTRYSLNTSRDIFLVAEETLLECLQLEETFRKRRNRLLIILGISILYLLAIWIINYFIFIFPLLASIPLLFIIPFILHKYKLLNIPVFNRKKRFDLIRKHFQDIRKYIEKQRSNDANQINTSFHYTGSRLIAFLKTFAKTGLFNFGSEDRNQIISCILTNINPDVKEKTLRDYFTKNSLKYFLTPADVSNIKKELESRNKQKKDDAEPSDRLLEGHKIYIDLLVKLSPLFETVNTDKENYDVAALLACCFLTKEKGTRKECLDQVPVKIVENAMSYMDKLLDNND